MIRSDAWAAPSSATLVAGEVHVWAIPIAGNSGLLDRLLGVLNAEERDRASRFVHIPAREQYVTTRGRLRQLVGQYLGRDPRLVEFHLSSTGKPFVRDTNLRFNVSHSHGMALLAFSRTGEVGVDVERVRSCPTFLDMASRYFTPSEAGALRSMQPRQSERAFFHVWTRKEAFLKATGLGLSHGLERFEVSVPPDDPARILHIDGDSRAGARWSMVALEPSPDHVGTLAAEGQGHSLRLWRWAEM